MMNRRKTLLLRLQWLYTRLIALRLQQAVKNGTISRRGALHILAISGKGIDVSPADIAPDEYGCAESVTKLISLLVPFKVETFTGYMADTLERDNRFERVFGMGEPGDIILSPTPFAGSQNIGHTGIFTVGEGIMSSDSNLRTWQRNYTYKTWETRYFTHKKLPIQIYRLKG